MKKSNLLIVLIILNFPLIGFSQLNYYKVDVKSKSEIKAEVELNQTVETIDYGAMALAEAKKEENRLKAKIYKDETQREYAKQIALNPLYAFDYGYPVTFYKAYMGVAPHSHGFDRYVLREYAKKYGFNYFNLDFKRPNEAMYTAAKDTQFLNESADGIKTNLTIFIPESILTTSEMAELKKKDYILKKQYWEPFFGETENWILNWFDLEPGLKNQNTSKEYFLHKSNIKKSIIFGNDGFVLTRYEENKYEKYIIESYHFISSNGLRFECKVEYKGENDKISFEQLESRRAYLGPLNRKIISSAYFGNYKLNND